MWPFRGMAVPVVPVHLFDALKHERVGRGYSDRVKSRDFRAVFEARATPEQARRVLAQLFDWCELHKAYDFAPDGNYLAIHNGKRYIGCKLLRVLMDIEVSEARPESAEKEE